MAPVITLQLWLSVIIHANGSHVGRVFSGICFCMVCLSVFLHDITKTDTARITKLDVELLHLES